MTARTVLITGGGSGIGAGLARAFAQRGATVIIAGPTLKTLEAVAAGNPGITTEELDVANAEQVAALAAKVGRTWPGLNTVVSNAGIQNLLNFAADTPPNASAISREIDVNLKGLVNVAAAFLPLLRRQRSAALINVGSGLGFVPLAAAPVYSATKAAVHSFTVSLRHQLAKTNVRVIELIPPVVETGLHRNQPCRPPKAMKLDAFVSAAIEGIDAERDEVPVGLAKALRIGARIAPGFFLGVVNKARA